MKTNTMKNSLLLFLTATIWGVAFVAQSVGMDYVGPFTFNAVRFFLGALVLLPIVLKKEGQYRKCETESASKARKKVTLIGGVSCGLALCAASLLQQFGIRDTTVAKAGFITALYIIIVPVLGLFFHKRVRKIVWAGVALALAGMYLLCIKDSFVIGKGDFLVFLCALVFSVHILVIDYFSPKADGVTLSCIQFFVSGVIGMILAFMFETPSFSALLAGAVPVLYAGVLSSGVAYTLQVVGQKRVEPTVASMILSMESVFSVLAGWLLLSQKLSVKELTGCVMVFAAVVMVQLPDRKKQEI